jgi:hypothetical protein
MRLFWDFDTSHGARHAATEHGPTFPVVESNRCASCDMKLRYPPDAGNASARELIANILEIFLQFFLSFPLRHVVWKFLDEAQPHLILSPVNVFQGLHISMMLFGPN